MALSKSPPSRGGLGKMANHTHISDGWMDGWMQIEMILTD